MYLNLVELAESLGVSERVVEDWVRDEGLPHVSDRGRLLFDRAQVVHWAAAHGLVARAGFLASENGAFTNGLALAPMLRAGGIWRAVSASGVIEVLERVIAGLSGIPQPVRALLTQRLRTKDGINWAPVGGGFALPHFGARVTLGRDAGVVTILLLREALPQADPTPDDEGVRRLLFFIPPSPRAHLDMLARLSQAVAMGPLRRLLEQGAPDEEILGAIDGVAAPAIGTESKDHPA